MLRHKALLGLISLLAILFAPLSRADVEDSHARIVRLSYVEGDVRFSNGNSFGFENATLNTPLAERDLIRTGVNGRVEVEFEDGSTIRLAPDSQLSFAELGRLSSGATVTAIDLDSGEAEFKFTRHDDDGLFTVRAHQRVITLKHSSRFRVASSSSEPLEVAVWKGEVGIQDPDTGREVAVKKNETFAQDPMDVSRYDLEKSAEADDLDQWSAQRDEYLSKYASSGYTASPYQYGVSDLNYYGQYYNVPGYGYCWRPNNVNLGWDPFMNGYWTYSPAFGNVWISAYPWGWMPYRYGHWVFVGGYGWVWQPGNFSNNWARGPRIVNPPAGFRVPVPPSPGVRAAGSTPASNGQGFVGNHPGTLSIGGRGQRTDDQDISRRHHDGEDRAHSGERDFRGQSGTGAQITVQIPEEHAPVRMMGPPVMRNDQPNPRVQNSGPPVPKPITPAPSGTRSAAPPAPMPITPPPAPRPMPMTPAAPARSYSPPPVAAPPATHPGPGKPQR